MEPADERIRRGFSETCDYDLSKVKEITDISRDGIAIEGKLVALAAWMKEQYGGTMIQALKTVLPIKQKENAKMKKRIRLLLDKDTGKKKLAYYLEKNQKARARLLAALLDEPVLEYELVSKKLNITLSVIRALEEQGVVALEENVFSAIRCGERHRKQERSHLPKTTACDRCVPGRLRTETIRNVSCPWRDGEREDGGLYRDDPPGGGFRQTGDRADPGDRADISDRDAVLPVFRRPGVDHEFPAVCGGTV